MSKKLDHHLIKNITVPPTQSPKGLNMRLGH